MPPHAENTLPDRLIRVLPGRFIVFDGPDGSGKTTQLTRLAAAAHDAGLDPAIVRDPGGTRVGERIRAILLEHSPEDIGVRTEMVLYMASRAQLVAHRIAPAIDAPPEENRFVLADRFYSSTLAYQGTAGGVPASEILQAALIACGSYRPDLTVIFDVDEDTAASRLSPLLDRMEAKGRAFHARVRQGYIDQAEHDPAGVVLINAMRPPDKVYADLVATLDDRLGGD